MKRGNCIDCGTRLTPETQSRHQPTIRCLNCFRGFSEGVEAVLTGKAQSARGFAASAKEAARAAEAKVLAEGAKEKP